MGSIILAGGRSTRLGQDKTSLIIAGEPLLHRTIQKLKQLGGDIILVLANEQQRLLQQYLSGIRIATDFNPGKGPLMGIYSGLQATHDDWCVTVACDMPFLNVDLLRYMMRLTPGFDVVVPRLNDMVEPLHAVYSKKCLKVLREMIDQDNLKVSNLLESMRVRYIDENDINPYDPDHLSWFNINTPEDLIKAEGIINTGAGK